MRKRPSKAACKRGGKKAAKMMSRTKGGRFKAKKRR